MIKLLILVTSSSYCCLHFKNRKHLSVIQRICIMKISVQFSFVTSVSNVHRQLTCGSGCLVVGLLQYFDTLNRYSEGNDYVVYSEGNDFVVHLSFGEIRTVFSLIDLFIVVIKVIIL